MTKPLASHGLFHGHLDVCAQCREHPFNLCKRGQTLLEATANDDAIARIHEIYGASQPSGTPVNASSRTSEKK